MEVIKVREDILQKNNGYYECQHCKNKFKDKDIILELDLYDDSFRFCSSECIMKWFKSDITEKKIEVYPIPDEVKLYNDISNEVKSMKPNTRIEFKGYSVEYFKIEGMLEHYIVKESISQRVFTLSSEVISYIHRKLIK